MRLSLTPFAALLPLAVLVFGAVWPVLVPISAAATPTVTIYDNDARSPGQGFDPAQGWWGYAPQHVEVRRGEAVVFHNPPTNSFPHTVTSITRPGGTPYDSALAAGVAFDSSPSQEAMLRPGSSWSLDTAALNPGNYAYYCRLHLWMLGSVTVTE